MTALRALIVGCGNIAGGSIPRARIRPLRR